MHEAGLAAAIATAVRDAGLAGRAVRILVAGGHDEPSAFDSSLLFHLGSALPETDPSLLTIVHEPTEHWCPSCGRRFEAVWQEACPDCGSAGMPTRPDEEISVEPAEGPGPSDPSIGDGGPSVPASGGAQAGSMEGSGAGGSPGAPSKRPDDRVT